jgi:transcription elongation factor Elf1
MFQCQYCGEELRFDRERGWVHARGGGGITLRCKFCGWKGSPYPQPYWCPVCGMELVDDHVALPARNKQ